MKLFFKKTFTTIITVPVLILMLIPFPDTASAQQAVCDTDFYSSNDILFYNPCDKACSVSAGQGLATISKLRGQNNAEKIFNFWVDAGLTTQQAAGITGSMKHEGGFSPFRQEMSQAWPAGGWGIAQFTHEPGQRANVKTYLIKVLGADLFNQYYSNEYGGAVIESNGFIPEGVPADVNEKFLLGELNYLLEHIKELEPNNTRRGSYKTDFNQTISEGVKLYDYLKTVGQAGDAATAWTYLYEFPGDIKYTSLARVQSANEIMALYSSGVSANCGGGLVDGGMNLEQAKEFMQTYKQIDSGDPNGDAQYLTGACHTLTDNCVTFSSYFVNKYTTLKFGVNHGAMVVNSTLALNTGLESGTEPRPYALFGTKKGVTLCDWDNNGSKEAPCGHTGIVLGVDQAKGVVIVGEAAFCDDTYTAAREYPLSEWTDGSYTYAYLDQHLNPDAKGGLQ